MRGIDCPRCDYWHMDADEDEQLLGTLQKHLAHWHPGEFHDEQVRALLSERAYEEDHPRAWLYELHVPIGLLEKLSDDQRAVIDAHVDYVEKLLDDGKLIVGGVTEDLLGIIAFFADNEDQARAVMEGDPTVASGMYRGVLRRYFAGFARGGKPHNMRRDEATAAMASETNWSVRGVHPSSTEQRPGVVS